MILLSRGKISFHQEQAVLSAKLKTTGLNRGEARHSCQPSVVLQRLSFFSLAFTGSRVMYEGTAFRDSDAEE